MTMRKIDLILSDSGSILEFDSVLCNLYNNVSQSLWQLRDEYKLINSAEANKILCLLNKMLNDFRVSSLRMRVEVFNLEKQFLQLKEEIEKHKTKIPNNTKFRFFDTEALEKLFYEQTHEIPVPAVNEMTGKDILIKRPADKRRIYFACEKLDIELVSFRCTTNEDVYKKLTAFRDLYSFTEKNYRLKIISLNALQKAYDDLMTVVPEDIKYNLSNRKQLEHVLNLYKNNKVSDELIPDQPEKAPIDNKDSDIITDQKEIQYLSDICNKLWADIGDQGNSCFRPDIARAWSCLTYCFNEKITSNNDGFYQDFYQIVLSNFFSVTKFEKAFGNLKNCFGAELDRVLRYSGNLQKIESFLDKYRYAINQNSDKKGTKICSFYKFLNDPISARYRMGVSRGQIEACQRCKGQR